MKLLTALLNINFPDYIGLFSFDIKDVYALMGVGVCSYPQARNETE